MNSSTISLTIDQIGSLLSATAHILRAELQPLGNDALRWHPAPEEWCINEVLGHLLEAEHRGFAGRIQRIVAQPGRQLVNWDQNQVAKERRDCERDGLELLHEFETTRQESLRTVIGLRPEQLGLSGDHPVVGELRVADLLHEWVYHDRAHVKQILSNVQALVRPHMANAQRFSMQGATQSVPIVTTQPMLTADLSPLPNGARTRSSTSGQAI